MQDKIIFFKNFVKNPREVGSILPSSRFLALKMISYINFNNNSIIVELGPGNGVFTDKIIERMSEKSILILFEINKSFFIELDKKYSSFENVFIINDSAENIKYWLDKLGLNYADYIISGIPFSSLPSSMVKDIFKSIKESLSKTGRFITFQYSSFKKKLFLKEFSNVHTDHVLRNFPPAYVLTMDKDY